MDTERPIRWNKSAARDFEKFPQEARRDALRALTVAAQGRMADSAKPMRGMGSGVFEIALRTRGDAFRVVYAVQLADAVLVIHAFAKKSTQGIRTPKRDIDLIRQRLKALRESI